MRRFQDSVDDITWDDPFFYSIEDTFGPIECYFEVVTPHSILEYCDLVGTKEFEQHRAEMDAEIQEAIESAPIPQPQGSDETLLAFHFNGYDLLPADPVYTWQMDLSYLTRKNDLYDFVLFVNGCYGFVSYIEGVGTKGFFYDISKDQVGESQED